MKKLLAFVVILAALFVFHKPLLTAAGGFLIADDNEDNAIGQADAAVVLNTGLNIYARLIEAANLYKEKKIKKIVINGDRKNDVLRGLEARGYRSPVPWYIRGRSILEFLGVSGDDIIAVSAPDAYDTVSEASAVGAELIRQGIASALITTSKFHTRRAGHIWRTAFADRLEIATVAARDDPFDPAGWWKSGRQVRWVMAEYGAWLYYYWKTLSGSEHFLGQQADSIQ